MSARGATLLLALALGFSACPLATRPQVVVEEVGVFQDQLSRARTSYDGREWAKALQTLDRLIESLTEWERAGRLQPTDEEIFLGALELRALCRFQTKDTRGAKEDFARLVTLRPERPLAGEANARAKKLYDAVLRELTGVVILTVEPPEAELAVDGRNLGAGYPRALHLLRGLHQLRWSRAGHEPETREVDVGAGGETSLEVTLRPNAKTVFFLVQPEGTELVLGGRTVARADRPALSDGELAAFCREHGADPASTFVIAAENLPPGEHRVALRRDCYEPREFTVRVAVDQNRSVPGYTRPVVLQRRSVTFRVSSTPAGATLILDGTAVGTTPLTLSDLCVGEHTFHLTKAGAGEHRATLTVKVDGPLSLDATLRPTLLWVGLTRDQETGLDLARSCDEALRRDLSELRSFNAAFAKELNPLLPDTFFEAGVEEADRRASVESLCEVYACQGLLVGKLTRRGALTACTVRLFLPGVLGFDAFDAELRSPMEVGDFLEHIDGGRGAPAKPTLPVADLPGFEGTVVVRGAGDPLGPGPGDTLLSVNGRPVKDAASARALLEAGPSEVTYLRGGETRTWKPAPVTGDPVTPYGGPAFPYRRMILLARQQVQAARQGEAALSPRMNLACAWIALGRPSSALEALAGAMTSELPPARSAALAYLRAVALSHLGRLDEAREHAALAASEPGASLDGAGAIPVQPLAEDLLSQLPTPPPPTLPLPGTPGGGEG